MYDNHDTSATLNYSQFVQAVQGDSGVVTYEEYLIANFPFCSDYLNGELILYNSLLNSGLIESQVNHHRD